MTTQVDLPLSRLRELRRRAAMTQHELADAAGVGRATIARLELGAPNPSPSTMRKLAAALKVEVAELLD